MSGWGARESTGGKAGRQGGPNHSNVGFFTGPVFNNLTEQKRSNDPASVERREKLADAKPEGQIGKMFERLVGIGSSNVPNDPSAK
ncbi:hypothetical protein F4780DRAFT_172283 [Xylariomycetidae sp. FL0641]|nr:hypothetical protein F4780DRAFT_172283 [Xylariomycetidae sp. FL0641]